MKKYLLSFIVILLLIVVSISYMGSLSQESNSSFASILVQNQNQIEDTRSNSNILSALFFDEAKNSTLNDDDSSSKYNYVAKYASVIKCNINQNGNNIIKSYSLLSNEGKEDSYNYSQEASNRTHELRIIKGVLVYFPIEQHNEYMLEFKWLYRSWIEMLKHEPAKWRTDLIVYITRDLTFFNDTNFFLNKLNCSFTNRRTSNIDRPMCTLIDYVPLKNRELKKSQLDLKTNREKYNHVLSNIDIFSDNEDNLSQFYHLVQQTLSSYEYLDSILMAFDGYAYLKSAGYNFLIRSDMDVFLTPLFAKWLPRFCNDFYVGRGGYSTVFNVNRLERISKNLGLEFASQMNLGSTWYSTPDQFRLISYLTLFGMSYLTEEEFTMPERERKLGAILWPQWHFPVVLLYGQNLMMNHLIKTRQLNIVKLQDHLDYVSYSENTIDNILFIHVFHKNNYPLFSKLKYKEGEYDNLSYDDKNVNMVKYYALKMALDAKRIPPENLFANLQLEIMRKI